MTERLRLTERFPVWFLLLYGLTSAFGGIYGTFFGVYLKDIGYTGVMIGTVLSVGGIVGLASQPFWGMVGDRVRSVTRLLRILLLVSAGLVVLYPLTGEFVVLLLLVASFTFFSTPVFILQDVVTLQAIEPTRWKFGGIRIGATVGFCVVAIGAGWVLDQAVAWFFPLAALTYALAAATTLKIPSIQGHQSHGNRVSPAILLKNRRLVVYTVFCFFLMLGISYYGNYFSIRYQDLGADGTLIGLTWTIGAIMEIPFLLYAERIIRRLGVSTTLLLAGLTMALRWLLLGVVTDLVAILFVNLLQVFSFIVVIYCMSTFINQEVPKELKSSGQGFYVFIGMGIPRILATFLGGLANDAFGIGRVFVGVAALTLATCIGFGVWMFRESRRTQPELPPPVVA